MIFANMPDEIQWEVKSSPEIREAEARRLARIQAPAVKLPCPEQGLYQWRKPGTRREPRQQPHQKRFSNL